LRTIVKHFSCQGNEIGEPFKIGIDCSISSVSQLSICCGSIEIEEFIEIEELEVKALLNKE
jgi:hypothetical protein